MTSRAAFVDAVCAMVGTPFRHRGRLRGVGLDCAGVPICALASIGVTVVEPPPYGVIPGGLIEGLRSYCGPVLPDEAMPGDLLAMIWAGDARHVGILVGHGMLVHARARSGRVCYEPLTRAYRVHSAWRIRGLT